MNALNVEAKLVAIASTPISTSINAMIFVYKIRECENVPVTVPDRVPLATEYLLTSKFLLNFLDICPPTTNNFRILEEGQKKSMQQHIVILGCVTRELIGW